MSKKSDLSYQVKIQAAAEKYHFQFRKSLGQNFLTDIRYLQIIVEKAALSHSTPVLEIGPGMGFLTEQLLESAGFVYSVELDDLLCRILQEGFAGAEKLKIIHNDALKLDFSALRADADNRGFEAPFKIVANLPYYITSPLITMFLNEIDYWDEAIVMVQKEVAQRIAAKPGNRDYGVLSIMTQYYAETEILATVPSKAFVPAPKVDSAILCLKKRQKPLCDVKSIRDFEKIIKAAFAQRRKTLGNAFKNCGFLGNRQQVEALMDSAGIEYDRRAESLTPEEFATLADLWTESKNI